jgi:two-component system invasion response regulator UvrY
LVEQPPAPDGWVIRIGEGTGCVELVFTMLKVLLVDDHAVVRIGLERILHEAFHDLSVGHADDGPAAIELALEQPWDVIVLDITLPTLNGLETLKQLKRMNVKARILMLSMHAGRPYVLGSLRAGAAGYLNKESAPDELVEAVNTVLAGRTYVSRALADILQSASIR